MTLSMSPAETPPKRNSVANIEMEKSDHANSAAVPPRRRSSLAKFASMLTRSKSTGNVSVVAEKPEHEVKQEEAEEHEDAGKLRRRSSLSTLAHIVTGSRSSKSTSKLTSTTSLDTHKEPAPHTAPAARKMIDIAELPKPEDVVTSIFEESNADTASLVVVVPPANKEPVAANYDDVVEKLGKDLLDDFEHMFDKLHSNSPMSSRKNLDGSSAADKKRTLLAHFKEDEERMMRSSQVSLNTKLNTLDDMMSDMKEFM